jgi:thiol-disulfide isomerase/thioredoxin
MPGLRTRFIALIVLFGMLLALTSGAAADPLGQGDPTPEPEIPPIAPPISSRDADLSELAAAVEVDNLEWENISFWAQGALGDSGLADLSLTPAFGEAFPNFEVMLLDGSALRLSEVLDRPLLVNFWASWCGPCRQELPFLIEAHKDPAAPFDVVLVNMWDEDATYRQFAADEFPAGMVSGRGDEALADTIGMRAIPVSVLLDGAGRLQAVHVGNLTAVTLAWLYALSADTPAVDQTDTESAAPDGADLTDLAAAVDVTNQSVGAVTVWTGGSLGLDEPVTVALNIGDKLPAFGLSTLAGMPFRSDVIEEPHLYNFWASWCGPCIEELPLLLAVDQAADSPFRVGFVNIWDDVYTYRAFLDEYLPEVTSPDSPDALLVFDPDGTVPEMLRLDFIPVSVLVDASGTVVLIQKGPISEEVLAFAGALLTNPSGG